MTTSYIMTGGKGNVMDKVLSEMAKIADEVIEHYKTDFTHWDTESYGRMYEGTKFIWLVCKYGTYILGIPSFVRSQLKLNDFDKIDPKFLRHGYEMTLSEYLDYIQDFSRAALEHYHTDDAMYFMVVKGENIKPITREKALKIVME